MSKVSYPILGSLRTESELIREFLAEFLGTFILMAIGNGGVAVLVLGNSSSAYATAYCYGVGAMIGIYLSMNISGGHINPAVTLALATMGKLPWRKVPAYFAGQYLGAFIASAIVYITYIDALEAHDGGHRVAWAGQGQEINGSQASGSIFATYPAPFVTLSGAFTDQVIGTALLGISICAITDKNGLNVPKYFQPLVMAFVVCTLLVAYGHNCSAVLNPARDLAPRIFTAINGWGWEPFKPLGGDYWWVAGILGPHLGAIIGVWIYYLTIELHHDPEIDCDKLALTLPTVLTASHHISMNKQAPTLMS